MAGDPRSSPTPPTGRPPGSFELDAIRPLVTHRRATGRHLVVTFTCPVSGAHENAQIEAPAARSGDWTAAVASRAKQTAWYELRRQVHATLYRTLGGSLASIAATAVDTALDATVTASGSTAASLSNAEQDALLVDAFRSVSSSFAWVGNRWVHTSAAGRVRSPFDAQLAEHPLSSSYDRLVAARIALEVARAHGEVTGDERNRLDDLFAALATQGGPDLAAASLDQRPPLTKAELAEVTAGPCRVTLLALGWAMAYADEAFDPAEARHLDAIAAGLGLDEAGRTGARDLARAWILDLWFDRAFAWGGHDAHLREQAVQLGARLGMSREEVEVAEAKFQRRLAG